MFCFLYGLIRLPGSGLNGTTMAPSYHGRHHALVLWCIRQMSHFRNAVFTLNNPDGHLEFDPEKMVYLVYQEEIGESGTYHFQGYCEFRSSIRFVAAKLLLGGTTVHLEGRRGTQAQAIAYAKKEDTRVAHTEPYEFGEPRTQGKRVDLEEFKNEVMAGKRKRDLVDDHYQIIAKYPRFYDSLTMMNRPTRVDELKVILLIGDTGLGKTKFVMSQYHDDPDFFVAPLNNGTMWYDTYDGHSKVLLDDFSGAASHISLCSLLRLLDRYPVLVPTKGSHTWWLPTQVFVTTNLLPKDWYKWDNRVVQYHALARRFHSVYLFYSPLSDQDCGYVEQDSVWWEENAPVESTFTVHRAN